MPELINIYCDESCHLEKDHQEVMACGIRNFFLEKSILINCQDSKLSAFIGDLGGI